MYLQASWTTLHTALWKLKKQTNKTNKKPHTFTCNYFDFREQDNRDSYHLIGSILFHHYFNKMKANLLCEK